MLIIGVFIGRQIATLECVKCTPIAHVEAETAAVIAPEKPAQPQVEYDHNVRLLKAKPVANNVSVNNHRTIDQRPAENWQQEYSKTLYSDVGYEQKLYAINQLTSEESISELSIGLGDNLATIRAETMRALAAIDTEASYRIIIQALYSESNAENKALAIELLSTRLDIAFHRLTIEQYLGNENNLIQQAANKALSQ